MLTDVSSVRCLKANHLTNNPITLQVLRQFSTPPNLAHSTNFFEFLGSTSTLGKSTVGKPTHGL
jgi:hypothetical protein